MSREKKCRASLWVLAEQQILKDSKVYWPAKSHGAGLDATARPAIHSSGDQFNEVFSFPFYLVCSSTEDGELWLWQNRGFQKAFNFKCRMKCPLKPQICTALASQNMREIPIYIELDSEWNTRPYTSANSEKFSKENPSKHERATRLAISFCYRHSILRGEIPQIIGFVSGKEV
ncbi:hypothetical protein CEXT_429161 [Caerostris extrusa]|uniref:Uncharacterized protein n=1 Tax=Caerostris extrusa TaxID=172846 RepID=A0AAV4MX69_CAEEX|nr:hypothetical protein CEXT_429161 [Caerostris extrusa]